MSDHIHIVATNWSGKFAINEAYRPIARALVEKYPELRHVTVNDILFIENLSSLAKYKDKIKNAQIGKMPERWQDIIHQLTGRYFGYVMEIYKRNVENMDREQIIVLIYHELRHIGATGDILAHDIEDWQTMLLLGPDWASTKRVIPDLLDDDVNWDRIKEPTLFNERELRAVK